MSTTTMAHPSFPMPFFTQLVHRLRCTNARYNQIAHQCRRTQHPTHHAKRRAYRAGLRIDTSKARAARFSKPLSATSTQLFPVLDRTARSPEWVTTDETEADAGDAEDACMLPSLGLALRNLPEVVVQKQLVTLCLLSSPLPGLGLGPGSNLNVDKGDNTRDMPFAGPIPGAPRWRTMPLPEDSDERGPEAMTLTKSASRTYDPNIWRGVTTTGMRVSDSVTTVSESGRGWNWMGSWSMTNLSAQIDAVYAGDHITVPQRHLKRKLRDVDEDRRAMFIRQPEVSMPDYECFSGTWRSEV